MLRTTLDSHPNLVCLAESFNPDLVGPEPYDTSWATQDILATHIFKQRQPKIQNVGFAVHRGGAPLGPWTDIWDHLLADPDLSVIMLHRDDLLRRFLSFQIMRERNRSGDPDYQPPPRHLDVHTLRTEFLRYEAELANFRRRFADHRRFQVSYEELRDQFSRTGLRLQRFLGVPIHAIAPRTQRNPQYRLSELVTNLAELRDAFHGSRWAWCFQTDHDQNSTSTEARSTTDRAVEGKAQLVRAPASIIRRRAPGHRQRRDIVGQEAVFYSRGREELVVRDFFQDRRGCIFVEVAADHPVHNSRTYYLERHLGWLGVALGVDTRHKPIYAALRPRTRVCTARPWAVPGEPNAATIEAPPTMKLTDVLVDQGVERIDWMTIGPAADPGAVFTELDFRQHRPRLLHFASPMKGTEASTWRRTMLEQLNQVDYQPVDRYEAEVDLYLKPR